MGRTAGSKNRDKDEVSKENVAVSAEATNSAQNTAEAMPSTDNVPVRIGKIRIQPSPDTSVIERDVAEEALGGEDPVIYNDGIVNNSSNVTDIYDNSATDDSLKETVPDSGADKGETETPPAPEEKPAGVKADDDIEDARFKGKGRKEIYKSYTELERLYGAQAGEIGTYRKLFDNIAQAPKAEEPTTGEELDFITEPQKAAAVMKNQIVEELNMRNAYLAQQRKLDTNHPDRLAIIETPEFNSWVNTLPPAIMSQHTNPEVADYILTAYKQTMATEKAHKETLDSIAIKKTAAAAMGTVAAAGKYIPTGKPTLSRMALAKLMMEHPAEYAARQSEIMEAYAEGRVK